MINIINKHPFGLTVWVLREPEETGLFFQLTKLLFIMRHTINIRPAATGYRHM